MFMISDIQWIFLSRFILNFEKSNFHGIFFHKEFVRGKILLFLHFKVIAKVIV